MQSLQCRYIPELKHIINILYVDGIVSILNFFTNSFNHLLHFKPQAATSRTISIYIAIIVIVQLRFVIASINTVNINCTLTAIS